MSDDLLERARFVVQLFRECDAIQLPHGPTEQVLTGMIDRIKELEAALATARQDALEELIAVIRRDEQRGDLSPGAAQWVIDSTRALIAQEQEPTT